MKQTVRCLCCLVVLGGVSTFGDNSIIVAAEKSSPGETSLEMTSADPWAPHPKAAPVTSTSADGYVVNANGTRTCSGGWQWRFDGITAGQTYDIVLEVKHQGLEVPRDALKCIAIWGTLSPSDRRPKALWDSLLPQTLEPDRIRFSRRVMAPDNASQLTIRATLRWTPSGRTLWQRPRVSVTQQPLKKRPPVRVCVVTGLDSQRRGRRFQSLQDNIQFYGDLCKSACRQHQPQLIVLPEIALQWGVPGDSLDLAVPAPGPETEAFAAIAREHKVRIALGMLERDGDAVRNSVVLIGPNGAIDGRYRKVHLAAAGEDTSGILPGDGFPVFGTELGRIGCNICMDSSAAESSRMVGLNGADFLLLPIMGDHRADRWSMGSPVFNEDRWRAIMRVHAIDNQLVMIVARNRGLGSCIINRKGDLLAWNDGSEEFITADVTLDDDYRIWQGGCFRDVNWLQRRPHLYAPFTDSANVGSLK